MTASNGSTAPRLPADWPPELTFLRFAARTVRTDEAEHRIRSLADKVEWRRVAGFSRYHKVQPLVYEALDQVCRGTVPDDFLEYFRRHYLRTAALNLRFAAEVHRIRCVLDEAGIPALFFKGSVIAQQAYGNLALRPCTDIDVLIPPGEFERTEHALGQLAYRAAKLVDRDGSVNKRALRIAGQCPFVHPEHPWSIDLHTSLMPPGYHLPVSFDELYERRVPVEQAGDTVPGFGVEDLLQILCLHGAKNRWEALKHVCDVAELIRAHPEIDWEVALERARAARGERILFVGLELASALLEAPIPDTIRSQVRQKPVVQDIARELESYMPKNHQRIIETADRMQFHMNIQDTLRGKLRYGLYTLRRRLQS